MLLVRVLYKLGREMQIGLSLEQRLAVDSETLDSMLRPRIQSSYGVPLFSLDYSDHFKSFDFCVISS